MAAQKKKILVIDDDRDFLNYMHIVLSANAYDVRTASNAAEGLAMMRQDPPDLVIVDVMISYVLDGWTISREMHCDPCLRHIPVMMVSAIVSDENDPLFPDNAISRVDAFMSKPLEPEALLRRVAELTQTG